MIGAMRAALMGVTVYREVLDQPVMAAVRALLEDLTQGRGEPALEDYARLFALLSREEAPSLGAWLDRQLRDRESPYPAALERGGAAPELERAARRDVETFAQLAALDCGQLLEAMGELLPGEFAPVLAGLPRWRGTALSSFEELTAFYRTHGAGKFARYRAFLWSGGALIPVADPDCPGEEELIGYDLQRDQVAANTRAFLAGERVNDVLLYGDSGTGKSATVKSLLAMPGAERLRLIEVQKDGLGDMAGLIRGLGGRMQRFILFIDDLAFDEDDKTYSMVKTILEGGLEKRPENVAIYATSNRRLLVRQTFSSRAGDEVDRQETIQEKTALSDRFGLRIPYLALPKGEYLALTEELARRAGVALPVEELRRLAVQWDMRTPGRTPRTARQFVASLRV